jgi:hypothetical protein
MVGETLALTRQEQAAIQSPMRKIGGYEWREPDYRQILLWAEALQMDPATVIDKLVAGEESSAYTSEEVMTHFDGGRMVSLSWNWSELPLSDFRFVEGITVEKLWLYGAQGAEITLSLPSLRLFTLSCSHSGLTDLDLSRVPNLTGLFCHKNQLTNLDLSHVPNLTKLVCWGNLLQEIDLSQVPNLIELGCGENHFKKLDLSHTPNLTELRCYSNHIEELDLSHVPSLVKLAVDINPLTELDLSHVPNLAELSCRYIHLRELNLSHVPNLTRLNAGENDLTELDIRPLRKLASLRYDSDTTPLIRRPDQDL